MPKSDFIIRAALAIETNNGWVWICGPSLEGFVSRTVVHIRRSDSWRGIYTEVRTIDVNFLRHYNIAPRIHIDDRVDTLVMAEWYRRALAIDRTTNRDNKTGRVEFVVQKANLCGWRSLRAACQHPDPVVRLGTRLGILGTWLGLVGLLEYLVAVAGVPSISRPYWILGLAVILAVLGFWVCWGPPRPKIPFRAPTT